MPFRVTQEVRKDNRVIGYNCIDDKGMSSYVAKDRAIELAESGNITNATVNKAFGHKYLKVAGLDDYNKSEKNAKSNKQRAIEYFDECHRNGVDPKMKVKFGADDSVWLTEVPNGYGTLYIPDFIDVVAYKDVDSDAIMTDAELMFGCDSKGALSDTWYDTIVFGRSVKYAVGAMANSNVVRDGITLRFQSGCSVTSLAAFFMDSNVKRFSIAGGSNLTKLSNISYMFSNCSNVRCIDLSSLTIDNELYMVGMSKNCRKLEVIKLPVFKYNDSMLKWVADNRNVMFSGMITGCRDDLIIETQDKLGNCICDIARIQR